MHSSNVISPKPRSLLIEALVAAKVGWFEIQEQNQEQNGLGVIEEVVPTNRLIWLEKGELAYCFEERELILHEGALWLVPEWTHRSWKPRAACQIVWVEFAAIPQVGTLPIVWIDRQPWSNLRQAVLGETAIPFQEMALKLLLMRLLQEGCWLSNPPTGDLSLHALLLTLREYLHEPDLLSQLPRRMGLSSRQVRERFRSALGMSPRDYIEMQRMHEARYLLSSTGLSVKEVSARIGYVDPLYFSRRYRLFWRCCPMQHRARNP